MLRTVRVLIAEDDRKLAILLTRGLREEGHVADVAATGEDALRMASSTRYEMIVLDLMLPGPGGVEVCRRLRTRHIPTPILILTARDTAEDRAASLDAGANDFMTKPFCFAELVARLRTLANATL